MNCEGSKVGIFLPRVLPRSREKGFRLCDEKLPCVDRLREKRVLLPRREALPLRPRRLNVVFITIVCVKGL